MKKYVFVFLGALLIAGCMDPNTVSISTRPKPLSVNEISLAKTAVSEQSRDPEAVKFRNLKGFLGSNGDTIVCGEVNAKNAYGGYVGYSPMWVRIRESTVVSTVWGDAFSIETAKACQGASLGTTTIAPKE